MQEVQTQLGELLEVAGGINVGNVIFYAAGGYSSYQGSTLDTSYSRPVPVYEPVSYINIIFRWGRYVFTDCVP